MARKAFAASCSLAFLVGHMSVICRSHQVVFSLPSIDHTTRWALATHATATSVSVLPLPLLVSACCHYCYAGVLPLLLWLPQVMKLLVGCDPDSDMMKKEIKGGDR